MFARNTVERRPHRMIVRGTLISLLISTAIWSQDEEEKKEANPLAMPDVVITAARTETLKDAVGGSVTVITKEDIKRRNPRTIADLLRQVPGVTVQNQGGRGRLTSVGIRGASSDNVLVLIDGVRVNSITAGGFDFGDLEPSNIERIEILRGPQSSLYGSEASAGVISIITQKGEEGFHGDLSAEAGTGKYHKERLRLRVGTERLKYHVSIENSYINAISAAWDPAGNKETDSYDNLTNAHRLTWDMLSGGYLDLSYRYSRSNSDLDAGPGIDDPDFTQGRTSHYGNAKYTQELTDWWHHSLRYGRATQDYRTEHPLNVWSNSEIRTDIQQAGTQADFFIGANNTLSIGYEHEVRNGEVVDNYQATYRLNSGYLENQLSIADSLHLTLGSRYDDFDQFGHAWTGRGSIAYKVADTRFHGSIGNGFRIPDMNDLFWPVDPFFGGGNPDLEAERSVGGDLGIEQALFDRKLILDVTYFENKYRNLIEWQNTAKLSPWSWEPINLDKARTKGTETTLTWQALDSLRLSGSHTYTEAEDLSEGGGRLARRPRNKFTTEAAFEIGAKLSGSLSMVAVRDRIDTDGSAMDNYERWDLALQYRIHEHLKTYLRIENLFDANYQEVNGYTTPGISGFAGISVIW